MSYCTYTTTLPEKGRKRKEKGPEEKTKMAWGGAGGGGHGSATGGTNVRTMSAEYRPRFVCCRADTEKGGRECT